MRKPLLTTIAGVMTMLTAGAQEMPKQNTLDYQPGGRELRLTVPAGTLTLRAVSPAVVEVKFTPPGIADKYRSVTIVESRPVTTTLADKAGELWFSTGQLTAAVEKATGRVRFLDSKGTELLAEMADGRKFTPARVGGEASWTPQQSFASPEDESLYGLGQHQDGRLDWRGETLRLWQANTEISIPFLWSTKGYGLLWDNPSDTWFNPGETVPLQNKHGVIRVAEAGDYSLYLNHTEGAGCWDGENTILVSGKPLISILNKWVPYGTGATMKLEANRDYPVELRGQGGLELILHKKTPVTTWRSKVGEAVDYYVIQGDTPGTDHRQLPGGQRPRADDAEIRLGLLAVPRALRQLEGADRGGPGIPPARDPGRHHRPGLDVLGQVRLECAEVGRAPLSRCPAADQNPA